jgi:glycosyltransferase involved in cell wall biosynthesis
LVIVGTGPEAESLEQQAQRLGLQDAVVHVGRVPHEQVLNYYSVMDVLVYPRHRSRVTELVTPLKPLEAMALGKAVTGSDVGGVTELLNDGRAGVTFNAGDARDLAAKVADLLTHPARLASVAAEGRTCALRKRSWEEIVPEYVPIYEQVLAHVARSRA